MYESRIQALKQTAKILEKEIAELEKNGNDSRKIFEKRQQLVTYQREISRLSRLQWEEDNERVDLDDDQ